MGFAKSKISVIKEKLRGLKTVEAKTLNYEYIECPEYKTNNTPPLLNENWKKAPENYTFGGVDTHFWLHLTIPKIEKREGQEPRLCVRTGKEGQWDARNPQFIVLALTNFSKKSVYGRQIWKTGQMTIALWRWEYKNFNISNVIVTDKLHKISSGEILNIE